MRSFVASALAVTCLLGLVAGASTAQSKRSPVAIKVVGLDGARRTLAGHNAFPIDASLSPDRRRFAFVPYVSGGGSRELWSGDVRTPREQLLVLGPPGWLSGAVWAPSGKTIAFSVYSQGHDPRVDGVWLVRSDGTNLQRVADLGYELAWSPDSRHLAFTQVANSRRFLSVFALDSGVITQLGEGQQAQWSPDGQKIAFQRVLGCDCLPEIRIASLLARTDRKLTGGADPVWSPDGRWVGFFRGTRSPPSLWAIPVTGGTARRLARRVSGSYWIMKWTRDSRSIAFVKDAGHCRTTLNLVRVRGGGARRLAVEHGLVSPLAWTSARRLLYADRVCSG